MGREIRKVSKEWEHPKDYRGHYIPLYDETYEEALAEWQAEKDKWDNGEYEAELYERYNFESYYGGPPDSSFYRPRFDNPNHFQIYENVTEGTPVSPIFASKDEMKEWLLNEGYSEKAASQFIEYEYAPSFVMYNGQLSGTGIHSYDLLPDKD